MNLSTISDMSYDLDPAEDIMDSKRKETEAKAHAGAGAKVYAGAISTTAEEEEEEVVIDDGDGDGDGDGDSDVDSIWDEESEDDELETLEEIVPEPPKPIYFRSSLEAHKKHLSLISKMLHEKDAEVFAGYKKYKRTYEGDTKHLFYSFAGHWRRTEGIAEWIEIILTTMPEIAQAKITGVGPVIYEKKMDGQIYSQKTMELVRTFKIYITPKGKAKIVRT
jgi:hypothetical protein